MTLSRSRAMPRSLAAAIATTAKASLISKRSTSSTLQPTLSSSLRIAGIGAVVYQAGSWLWVAWALISARIGRPSRSACERRVRTSAAAPSALAEALAAVIVPSARNAGFRVGIFSGETFSGMLVGVDQPIAALAGTGTGAISAVKAPSSIALRAPGSGFRSHRRPDRRGRTGRPVPRPRRNRPWSGRARRHPPDRRASCGRRCGRGRRDSRRVPSPAGRARSTSIPCRRRPRCRRSRRGSDRGASMVAFMPEPQTLLTVVAPT